MDGSAWDFWFWAAGQPSASGGSCVSMYTHGEVGVGMKSEKAWGGGMGS